MCIHMHLTRSLKNLIKGKLGSIVDNSVFASMVNVPFHETKC